jgi:sorbitol-6-phosphate 2-dehydrogenase
MSEEQGLSTEHIVSILLRAYLEEPDRPAVVSLDPEGRAAAAPAGGPGEAGAAGGPNAGAGTAEAAGSGHGTGGRAEAADAPAELRLEKELLEAAAETCTAELTAEDVQALAGRYFAAFDAAGVRDQAAVRVPGLGVYRFRFRDGGRGATPGRGAGAVAATAATAERREAPGAAGHPRTFAPGAAGCQLFGKTAVVTGGAQGFGAAISAGLTARGADVCVADIDEDAARAKAEELASGPGVEGGCGGTAYAVGVDVSRQDSVGGLLRAVIERSGRLDVFVSNAGVLRAGSVLTLDEQSLRMVTSVNYLGFFNCAKHAGRAMAVQNHALAVRRAAYEAGAGKAGAGAKNGVAGGGAEDAATGADRKADTGTGRPEAAPDWPPVAYSDIIQINSKSGLEGSKKNGAYAGSKFGGVGLTQSFALELIEHYVKVNAVCPGNFFEGPLWSDPEKGLFVQYLRAGKVPGAQTIEDVRRAYEAKVPMGRGCRGEDVLKAIAYIIDQDYETGQAVPVTGGQTMLS